VPNDDLPETGIETEPNYHHLHELTEATLAKLDFYRYDNFFAARPAYGYFSDASDSSPKAPRLFGEYWLRGELAILFADTGTGKSILATQIAQSIASGIPIEPFGLETPAQRVAYFDLELSQEQFDRRYSHDDDTRPAKFPFHRNLIRNAPHPHVERPDAFKDETQFITSSMVEFIEFSKAKVVIVDNMTWLNNSAQIGNSAPRLMKALSRLRQRLDLSILVLAHTPKRRLRSPLTENDIQGSKLIADYADAIFALGSSRKGTDIRYLKSVKRRHTKADDPDRTATLLLEKDVCWLSFRFEDHSDERDHIGWMSSAREPERMILIEKILELEKQGLSQRQIGLKLGVSASTVNRCLKDVIE
jgi:RecA-family ATPase